MAIFYRGAGIGTYWHTHDARLEGFIAHSPGAPRSLGTQIGHIKNGTTTSPYISLTRSYSVALTYAVYCGQEQPDEDKPAFVYEIELTKPLPTGLDIFDPAYDILAKCGAKDPLADHTYQHDGFPDFIAGVIDRTMRERLTKHIAHPPPGIATARSASLSESLEAVVRAIRDAELLAVGTIPTNCIICRYEVHSP